MFKKFAFKGKGRTLNDPPPKKETKPPATPPREATEEPQKPIEPIGPPPGPDNRQTVISTRDAHAVAKVPKSDSKEEDYELKKGDLKGLRVGSNVAPKTFADVNRPKSKPPPNTASIRFTIPIGKEITTVDARFQTSESLQALYDYLEKDVFQSVDSLEIRQTFPTTVIPREPNRTLASLKLHGQVMLQVNAVNPVLKKD